MAVKRSKKNNNLNVSQSPACIIQLILFTLKVFCNIYTHFSMNRNNYSNNELISYAQKKLMDETKPIMTKQQN